MIKNQWYLHGCLKEIEREMSSRCESAFLRQLSMKEMWGYCSDSNRWRQKEGAPAYAFEEAVAAVAKKRVVVVIDDTPRAKQAMMWALTHVTSKGDILTLLHAIPPHQSDVYPAQLANSLRFLCKACKPEVEVEALVVQGPKLQTVLSQVKKLEASVLVLSQGKPSPLSCLFGSRSEEFVEQCVNRAECLTLAVRKQRRGVGGYLISTRWQKNFWLLA